MFRSSFETSYLSSFIMSQVSRSLTEGSKGASTVDQPTPKPQPQIQQQDSSAQPQLLPGYVQGRQTPDYPMPPPGTPVYPYGHQAGVMGASLAQQQALAGNMPPAQVYTHYSICKLQLHYTYRIK